MTPEQREKRKKLLLFLPVPVLLFAALIFLALGSGKGKAQDNAQQKGINTELPSAQFKGEKPQDKLSLYDQAAKDSASEKVSAGSNGLFPVKEHAAGSVTTTDNNAAQISQKLAQIREQMGKAPEPPVQKGLVSPMNNAPAVNSADIDRLEKLAQGMKSQQSDDPQMKQLAGMMDKIFQIQHPELVNQQLKQEVKAAPDSAFKAIPAMIDGNQKVAPGGVVRLRLSDTLRAGGLCVPKGQLLFGACTVTNQRLLLDIRNIRLGSSIIPVSLTVFALDGLPGINAPEAELGEAAGNGTAGALDNMQFLSMDNSLSTQAATAGISAAKGLLGKKVRKIRVKLKGGQTVLLRVNKS
ncbi:conjugative transposon protein TraM [Mucilaginibacter sp. BJC16-A38]|nr:conjugative transposon protein TraM [Mucilaginibacter phenanthrenivorans]